MSAICRLNELEQPPRESSLKYQTRCVAAFTGAGSFALGSVEGRVAMEVLDPSPAAQEKKYAFKVSCSCCTWQVLPPDSGLLVSCKLLWGPLPVAAAWLIALSIALFVTA